ncbi:unnamed protein product, partial [Durusdinium trenchii]
LQFAQLVRHRSSASMELANGCRPHPTLALAFQRMETPVSCFPLFTFATKTANAAHAAHRRWRTGRQRLPSLGLGPWATAGTEAICDQVVPWMLMTSHTSPPHVHRPQGLKAYPMAANLLENQERPQGSLPLAKPCFSGCVQHWK